MTLGKWRAAGALAALAGVWCVSAGFRVAQPAPGPIDRWWDAVMVSIDSPWAHGLATTLAVVGSGLPASGLAVVLGVLVGAVRGWVWGVVLVVSSIISALDVAGMKALAQRARPDPAFGLLNAFPSGHTANAAVLGSIVFLLVGKLLVRAAAVVWMLAMAWSRTELHAHWLTDVLAAIVVGAATAILLVTVASGLRATMHRSHSRAGAAPSPGST